jgi:archaeosortase A (PGF-CTERM-specific)
VLFGLFWLQLFPHFALVQKSFVEGALTLVAGPACAYTGWLLYRGRDSLFVLSRAVPAMGVVYLLFETVPGFAVAGIHVPAPRQVAIETVAAQTGAVMNLLGYYPSLIHGDAGYLNTFVFPQAGAPPIHVHIVLACTGIGSMVIFVGLAAAVEAPLGRKLKALGVALPVIYVLNVARTTFINLAFGEQLMQWFVPTVSLLFGLDRPQYVSYILSDRVLSQVLAVVALVAITFLVVRQLPEVLTVVEDILYVALREEYDLAEEFGVARDDGGRL